MTDQDDDQEFQQTAMTGGDDERKEQKSTEPLLRPSFANDVRPLQTFTGDQRKGYVDIINFLLPFLFTRQSKNGMIIRKKLHFIAS